MASGNIGASSDNQYVVGNLSWSSTTNVAGNYSDVYAELRMWRSNSGYTTYGTGTWDINIDGNVSNSSSTVSLSYGSNTYIMSMTQRIYHNSDGSKSISISAHGGISGTSYTTTYCGSTVTLDTIPRASTPSVSGSITIGSSGTINISSAVSSFTHTISYAYGSIGKTQIVSGLTGNTSLSCSWTPNISLCSQTPSSTSGTGTIYCDTYNGGTLIGTKTCAMTLNVPSTVVPTFSALTPSELVSAVSTVMGSGVYVKSLSNVKFTLTGGAGAYGSTITSGTVTFNGSSYFCTSSGTDGSVTASYTTGVLGISGTISYSAWFTDSRGRVSATRSGTIVIRDYTPPTISTFTVQRCTSAGVVSDLGDYVKIVRVGTASSLINSTEKNTIACTVKYKLRTEPTVWTTCTSGTNPPSNPIGINVTASSSVATAVTSTAFTYGNTTPLFPITNAYDFRVELVDKFNTTISTVQVSTGTTVMSWSKTGIGVGKVIPTSSVYAMEVSNDGILIDGGGGIYSGYNNAHIFKDHGNGNVTLSGAGSLLYLGYQNTTSLAQCKSLVADGFMSLGSSSQLVGDYVTNSSNNKMIWTIGTSWNTWATHYGIAYEYGAFSYFAANHQITFRSNGVTKIRLGFSNGEAWYNGGVTVGGALYVNRIEGLDLNSNFYMGTGNCRIDTTSGTIRIYTTAVGSSDSGLQVQSDGTIMQIVGSSSKASIANTGNGWFNGVTIGSGNEIKSTSIMYVNYNNGGSGLQVCNGAGSLGPIYGSTKSAVVETENYGSQILYCDESPNHVFHDGGHGVLDENGLCYIYIDSILLETIATKLADYNVYLTGFKDANVEILDKQSDYFVVCGNPNKEFDWLLRAERKGMERLRFNDGDIII